MIYLKRSFLLLVFFSVALSPLFGFHIKIQSPDKQVAVKVTTSDKIYYSVLLKGKEIIKPSPISLTLKSGAVLGQKPKIGGIRQKTINEKLTPVVKQKNAVIANRYSQLILTLKGGYALEFRAYNDAAAYRFILKKKQPVTVMSEEVAFTFAGDHHVWFPAEKSLMTHQERSYEYIKLSSIGKEKFSSLPALVDIEGGPKVALLETDLEDYPGMYLRGNGNTTLSGLFPGVALKEGTVDLKRRGGDRNIAVLEYADHIAVTKGTRSLPWRVAVIAQTDAQLVETEIVHKLAKSLQLKDTAWIKPGKVAWDWWNYNNIDGVDFEAGLNTATYKYYIDFAAKYGIPYIILDEGWYELGDLTKINPDIDMEALLAYGKQKNVGLILWVVWKTLADQLDTAMGMFEKWGVKGIKVDFMQRDDQWMVNYYHRIAKEAAKGKLIVDFHGSYTPKGLRRAYPNVLTREGVKGLEHYKWKSDQGPEHEVTLPFIRMLAGPMDFTPGAMLNAQKGSYAPFFQRPMSKGTRARQLAMYVVYESPLQMLADSPSNYLREAECMEFLASVPTVWDETVVLKARVGDYIAVARRNGSQWYVGAMTDWTARELELSFDFLPAGKYKAVIFRDGVNAHRMGGDYKKVEQPVSRGDVLNVKLAPGGGWAAILSME